MRHFLTHLVPKLLQNYFFSISEMRRKRYGAREMNSPRDPSRQKLRYGNHSNPLSELRGPKYFQTISVMSSLRCGVQNELSPPPKRRCCKAVVLGQVVDTMGNETVADYLQEGPILSLKWLIHSTEIKSCNCKRLWIFMSSLKIQVVLWLWR